MPCSESGVDYAAAWMDDFKLAIWGKTDALVVNFLGFWTILAGCAHQKSSNCVSPIELAILNC